MEENFKDKVLELIQTNKNSSLIVSKLIEYELKIIAFISTVNCYKTDSLLKPFPKFFLTADNKKDFDRLNKVAKHIPNLNDLNSTTDLPAECWQLIHWILTFNSIELQLLDNSQANELFSDLKLNNQSKLLPNYVFKFYSPFARSSHRARHNKYKDEYGYYKAFHGTRFENLHSILHNGLINNLNKRDVFGAGTYLSKSLEVGITFSPYSNIKTNCSTYRLSCILLCDVIQHPSISVKETTSYLLVKDDDLVNISHVFVYWQKLNNQKRSFPKFEIVLLLMGIIVVLYSIYRGNKY